MNDLNKMIEYAEMNDCRMKYLTSYLGDTFSVNCGKCDFDKNRKFKSELSKDLKNKINDFRNNYFPIIELDNYESNIVNGVAASYYGVSNIGRIIHKCKYENAGDFPENLVKLTLRAFYSKFKNEKFDLILYVPSTESGKLVEIFAKSIAFKLNIKVSNNLKKKRTTKPQKIFQNKILKDENVSDAYTYTNPNEIIGKSILLIDDIFDSGSTIREIGKLLTRLGAVKIVPIVIAKTIGGDKISQSLTTSQKNEYNKNSRQKPMEKAKSKNSNYIDKKLFNDLKHWRLEKSREFKFPAFCIFSDKTLNDIVEKSPQTTDDLLEIKGIGKIKLQKYGHDIIKIVKGPTNK